MNTKKTENTKMNNDWFNQQLEPVDLNNLEYIPDPEEPIDDWRVTRIDKHVGDDDYIAPLKKPKEEDPIAKLDLTDTHSNRFEPVDYESSYKTMDPFFEMLFKPLDDPLFQPTPELEDLDRRLSEMYYKSIDDIIREDFVDNRIRDEDFDLSYYHYQSVAYTEKAKCEIQNK
jgi:hypothetical protein